MSHQLTLEIAEDVYQALLKDAQATGRSVEATASECLARAVEASAPAVPSRPWIGTWASGVPDASLRHDHYIGQALAEELGNEPDA
jgi:hypothetical protein